MDAFVAGSSDRLVCRGEFGPVSDLWPCDQSEAGTESWIFREFCLKLHFIYIYIHGVIYVYF